LDDINMIARGATEAAATANTEELLAKVKKRARDLGFDTHKDQCGRVVDELGMLLRAQDHSVVATPAPKKFCLLLNATRFLLKCKHVRKDVFLSLLGHWAWVLQLNRSLYSCLAASYDAAVTVDARLTLSPKVLTELRWLVWLAPAVRADLGAPLCRSLFMVDAGPEGGAVVRTTLKPHVQFSADVLREDYPRNVWRNCARGAWSYVEHNNLTESRTSLWALERAGRDEARHAATTGAAARPLRVVVYTDSLVAKGAFSKGRSSSRNLNKYCRKAAALCVLFGLQPKYRYVPTDANFADGPSRGLTFPCVHPDTTAKAAAKAANRAAVPETCTPAVFSTLDELGAAGPAWLSCLPSAVANARESDPSDASSSFQGSGSGDTGSFTIEYSHVGPFAPAGSAR
jgi:hypothetical protein